MYIHIFFDYPYFIFKGQIRIFLGTLYRTYIEHKHLDTQLYYTLGLIYMYNKNDAGVVGVTSIMSITQKSLCSWTK